MPRMHSSSAQCCLCVVGVFLFLFGIIMLSMGVCLLLNYGLFDSKILPEELRSDDGKRIIGIIFICAGIVSALISILVSTFYLCSRSKDPIEPTLSTIPASARNQSDNKSRSLKPHPKEQGRSRPPEQPAQGLHSGAMPANTVPSSSRARKKHKRKRLVQKSRLEGIHEANKEEETKSVLSRKQSEADLETFRHNDFDEHTPVDEFTTDQTNEFTEEVALKLTRFTMKSEISVKEAAEKDSLDNSSTESGYTDSVITGGSDKFDFDDQVNKLVT